MRVHTFYMFKLYWKINSMNTTIVPWILWDIFYKPQGNEPRQIASTFDSIIENVVDFIWFSNVSSKKSNLMTSYIYICIYILYALQFFNLLLFSNSVSFGVFSHSRGLGQTDMFVNLGSLWHMAFVSLKRFFAGFPQVFSTFVYQSPQLCVVWFYQ